MIQEIKMPAAGQTTNKATIAVISVKEGDTVKRGDVLLEAETDKAILPVESYAEGEVLAVLVKEGDTVDAGSVLMAIGKKGEVYNADREEAPAPADVPASAPAARTAESDPAVCEEYLPIIRSGKGPAAAASAGKVYPAMPGAKMLAQEKGVDLSLVVPDNGMFIKRSDVLKYKPATAGTVAEADYKVMPLTRMRSIIGQRMQESMQNIPAWQCTVAIDMRACMELRETYQTQKGIKLSYNDIMAKATAVASRKFPLVNARYENGEVRIYDHTNVGLAVAVDEALVVPVIRDADIKGLEQIAADDKELVKKARDGRLMPADMGCGSITISNLGMFDVDQFIAIVNPPESGILAVGSIRTEPVWNGAVFQPVPRMTVTGSFDHRIIDGAYGAQFLRELKLLMENPALMLY